MNVKKTVLDRFPMPYAVGTADSPSLSGVLFASEVPGGPGRLYRAGSETETLWDAPGGVMNVIPDGDAAAVWSIQKFFPVFQSADAEIVRTERLPDGAWASRVMAHLPYVHRIARFTISGEPHMLACTLCEKKDFEQDWTHPGSVYVSRIVPDQPLDFQPVLCGLTKNHGLAFHDESTLLVGSADGVFRIAFRGGAKIAWDIEKIIDRESSEALLFDLDGDGQSELITIDGFHGDAVHVYKKSATGWELRHEIPITFGHVLWVGELLGRKCVLVASRGGDKAIRLHFPVGGIDGAWEEFTVDTGVGATQIAVINRHDTAVLHASNHGAGEVATYIIAK